MTARHCSVTRSLVLRRGDCRVVYEPARTILVCVEGRVSRTESIPGAEETLPRVVQVALRAGESYLFDQAASVTLTAESSARLLCLRPQSAWRVLAAPLLRRIAKYAMMTNIRRGVEQSGSSSGS